MADISEYEIQGGYTSGGEHEFRQALMRLIGPQMDELQARILHLKEQIDRLQRLEGDTSRLHEELAASRLSLNEIEERFLELSRELRDPAMMGRRLDQTVVPALQRQVESSGEHVAEVLAPVIGPAIRHQIRDAKDDIIDALYPLIGQIIGKAISEALRELTRSIDARMRQQLNFRDRIGQALARLRGVSEAELLLRESLPYSVERVFLIHRETGLLLTHLTAETESTREVDTISGMLTAIQDFVRDSFTGGEGELEEITHGDLRILLEGGRYAYVAVVLNGVEPGGYNHMIRDVISRINFEFENELREFNGDMRRLPELQPALSPLLAPSSVATAEPAGDGAMSGAQKRMIGAGLLGFLLLAGLTIFACLFVIRLWPVAFPAAVAVPAFTTTPSPTSTLTFTPTSTATAAPTLTPAPVPTGTSTAQPTPTPALTLGVLSGNLYVRSEPSENAPTAGVVLAGEQVVVHEELNGWYRITWPVDGGAQLEGWIWGLNYLEVPADAAP